MRKVQNASFDKLPLSLYKTGCCGDETFVVVKGSKIVYRPIGGTAEECLVWAEENTPRCLICNEPIDESKDHGILAKTITGKDGLVCVNCIDDVHEFCDEGGEL